jgi:ribosomal protein S8E
MGRHACWSSRRGFRKHSQVREGILVGGAKINQLREQRIKQLGEKLIPKNEGITEIMKENVKARIAIGDNRRRLPVMHQGRLVHPENSEATIQPEVLVNSCFQASLASFFFRYL